MSEDKTVELAEQAKKPGVFSIINAIQDRAYPHDEVNIYLDEQTAYEASLVKTKLNSTDVLDNEYEAIEAELNKLLKTLEKSKYVFTITGISEGKREEIYDIATEKYPVEYRETKNNFTGETKREEIENVERDNFFTSLIWAAHITKIVDPEGNVQGALSPEEADTLRLSLPLASSSMINKSIETIRSSTALFMYTVDEDFLAKS